MSDNELRNATQAKSDQMNVEDFFGDETKTITITQVKNNGGLEQPVSVHFEGDNGKPYKPNKSMCRVITAIWGGHLADYIGKRMTIYVDRGVTYGGIAVGGLKISHMSGIKANTDVLLTAKRGLKKPHTVKPLADAAAPCLPADDGAQKYSPKVWAVINGIEVADEGALEDYKGLIPSMGFKADELKVIRSAYSARNNVLKATEPELSADARSAIVMLKTCPANDMDDWGTKFATMGFSEVELKAIRVAYSARKKELKACP